MAHNIPNEEATVYLTKRTPKQSEARSQHALTAAMKSGQGIDSSKKYGGGGNKQRMSQRDTSAVCRDTEEMKVEHVSLDLGKLIMKGRNDKKMTQKELATKINEKPQVIQEYESGKAIPNNQITSKIERAIGLKLRGKNKGQPL